MTTIRQRHYFTTKPEHEVHEGLGNLLSANFVAFVYFVVKGFVISTVGCGSAALDLCRHVSLSSLIHFAFQRHVRLFCSRAIPEPSDHDCRAFSAWRCRRSYGAAGRGGDGKGFEKSGGGIEQNRVRRVR